MIKLDSLTRWTRLGKGQILELPGETNRRIRLNVNSPGYAGLYTVDADGLPTFLATADRRDVIEFAAEGNVRIGTQDDDVFVYTAENEPTFTIIENAEVFTQIATRAVRNPDLEYMMFLQEQNIQRRIAQLETSVNQRVQEAYDAGKATVAKSDAPGTAAQQPASTGPKPDSLAGAPISGAGEAKPSADSGATSDGLRVGDKVDF